MATCTYGNEKFSVPYLCPLEVVDGAGQCILHSADSTKDEATFLEALRRKILLDHEDPSAREIQLDGVVFPGRLVWLAVTDGLADLRKPLRYTGATFYGDAHFSVAAFIPNADFRDVTFRRDANFIGTTFKGEAVFLGATFALGANFSGATFAQNGHFSSATFTGDADFGRATFAQDANFFGATFAQDVNFVRASFARAANFFRATFTGTGVVHFAQATFTGDANFSEASFTGDANFSRATFSSGASFQRTAFRRQASFEHTTFRERLVFQPDQLLGTGRLAPALTQAFFQRPEMVTLASMDFRGVSLLSTNLSKLDFVDVVWDKKSERCPPWIRHNVLHDHLELDALEKEAEYKEAGSSRHANEAGREVLQGKARQVSSLYRQLRMTYERSRQYSEAGHFYIGQMDMRRRDPETGWFMRRLALPLYRAIAMYGESAWRPLILYLLTSFVFAALYLYAGFYWGGEETHKAVDYAWRWGGFFLPFSGDFLKAEYLALTAGSLLRGNVQVMADWGLVVAYANMVWDIFLVALFVIALRRHFRR